MLSRVINLLLTKRENISPCFFVRTVKTSDVTLPVPHLRLVNKIYIYIYISYKPSLWAVPEESRPMALVLRIEHSEVRTRKTVGWRASFVMVDNG